MSSSIQALLDIAKAHDLEGSFTDWSKRGVWWFDAPMPDAMRSAGAADAALEYYSYDGDPHNRAEESFVDKDRLAIAFPRAR